MKVKLWFVHENVTKRGEFGDLTKKAIELIHYIEKTYDKKIFDLRLIEYTRFLAESKKEMCISKDDLPVVLINEKIIFRNRLPSPGELKREIDKAVGGR